MKLRLTQLDEENRDLRDICNENGSEYQDQLAARRHKRSFARLCAKHPLGRMAAPSDALTAPPIVRRIGECACSCFFAAFPEITATFNWQYGCRSIATLLDHRTILDEVYSMARLDGGRLASAGVSQNIVIHDIAKWPQVTVTTPGGLVNSCHGQLDGHGSMARVASNKGGGWPALPNLTWMLSTVTDIWNTPPLQ